MTQNEKPLITIAGALSKQGRSATQTLLQSGRYRVRALTRNISSPEARILARQGAELYALPPVPGNKKDLVNAFAGSEGAFLMTPVIKPPATYEFELGCQLADAAVAAGVEHIIFSGLENVDKITNGKKFAPHFTDKSRIEEYIRDLRVNSTFIYLSFFYTNLLEYYTPRIENGELVFPIYLPKEFRAPFVDSLTATGPAVLEIFSNVQKYAGQSLPIIGEFISPAEMVFQFTQVTGKKAVYGSAYTRVGLLHYFPDLAANEDLVRECLGMVEYAVEYGYFSEGRDLLWSQQTNPQILTWEQFLRSTGWQGEKQSFFVHHPSL
jgi:uncharacterized protein YbjT (DUF2867 family)